MFSRVNYGDDRRFDSAMELPISPDDRPSSPTTSYGFQNGTMSSTTPFSEPWSQVNTRSNNPRYQPRRPDSAHAYDPSLALSNPTSGLENHLASLEAKIHLPIDNTTTYTSCPSSPNSSLPLPWATASSSTTPTAPPSIGATDDDIICCGQCGVEFTGVYRRGNLGRHVRHKHTQAKGGPFTCMAEGCYKVFARQDARLKHARNHHPGLHGEPIQRKQGHKTTAYTTGASFTSHDGPTPVSTPRPYPLPLRSSNASVTAIHQGDSTVPTYHGLNTEPYPDPASRPTASTRSDLSTYNYGSVLCAGQWLPSLSNTSVYGESIIDEPHSKLQQVNSSISVEELPRAARIVFAGLHDNLDDRTYAKLCDATFTRLESVVQYLRDEQSDTYTVYAKVLVDLYAVVHAIDSGVINWEGQGITGPRSHCHRTAYGSPTGSLGNSNPTPRLGIDAGSPSRKSSKYDGHRLSKQGRFGENRVAKANKPKREDSEEVDCPDYKHHIMHRTSRTPPCRGCREVYMSQIRNHLNRVDHRGRSGAWQCSCCKKDFNDQEACETHEAAGACPHQPLRRGEIVLQWARLYLTRYPNATRIPSPFCDEYGWLPDSVLTQCRSFPVQASTSFLDQRSQERNTPNSHIPSDAPNDPVVRPEYDVAMEFTLRNIVAPMPVQSNDSHAAVLSRRVARLNTDPQAHTPGPSDRDVDRFLSALQGASAHYFRMLAEAPGYLTSEQMQDMADEAQLVVHHVRNYQRRQSEESRQRLSDYPVAATNQPTEQIYDSSYVTSMRRQPSQATSYDYFSTPGMSTQSSSQGFDTGSSQYRMSPHTGPSSIYEPVDPMFLSPFPDRRTSRSSEASYRGTPQHVYPQAADAYNGTPTPLHIDPALLQRSLDYQDPQDDDIEPNMWARH